MPVVKVKAPDGSIVSVKVPEGASDADILEFAAANWKKPSATSEWISDALKYGPGFLKETGKNALNALGTAASEMPAVLGDALGLPARLLSGKPSETPAVEKGLQELSARGKAGVDRALPPRENLTPEEKLWSDVTRGGATALLGAPGVRQIPAAMAAGGIGTLTGKGARGFAEQGFGVDSGPIPEIAEILGSLVGGGATAYLAGPKQLPAHREIREATEGTNWSEVSQNVDDLIGSGAKTATLGEAFPQGSGARDLVGIARSGTASNALKERMTNRADDLSGLGKEFLNRIGPEVNANAVSERVAQAANAIEANLNQLKNTGFRNRVEGASVRPDLVKKLEDALLAEANKEVRGGPKGAYREIASSLRNPDTGQLITSVPELSKVLYGFQTQMKNGAVLGKAGNSIQANDMGIPLKNAKQGLEELSPPFEAANAEARIFNQGPRTEFAQSPLKKLADRNPAVIDPTPASRMEAITQGTTPQEIAKVLATLERDPGLAPGQGVGAGEITRAMMQQRLKGAPTNPGAAVRQNPGSDMEAQIAQMLTSAGKDPQRTMQPLRAADLMQDAPLQGGTKAQPKMLPMQWLIRTLRSADMTVTRRGFEGIDKEIARLLADPANLAEVRKIAMFDPAVRRQLSIYAPVLGTSATSEGQ